MYRNDHAETTMRSLRTRAARATDPRLKAAYESHAKHWEALANETYAQAEARREAEILEWALRVIRHAPPELRPQYEAELARWRSEQRRLPPLPY